MPKMWTMLALAGTLALAAPAGAQGRGGDRNDDVPRSHRPPPGMCRVWLDGVPPGQQPAPTDCKTALRNRPAKARVIFGDDYVDRERKRESTLRGFNGDDKDKPARGKKAPWRRP